MIVDSHHHLWSLERADYGWLTPDQGFLYKDYGPEDFWDIAGQNGVGSAVVIQAAPTVEETAYLLSLAETNPYIKAVVGWVDFGAPECGIQLKAMADHPKFRGVRPMLQDLADEKWILKPEFHGTFESMLRLGLSFDALVQPRHLRAMLRLTERYPNLRLVINHCAKPYVREWTIGDAKFKNWSDALTELGKRPNVFCKLSALPNRAAPGWSSETFAPYVHAVLSAFGSKKVMWASDWPITERNGTYKEWLDAAKQLIPAEFHGDVFALTAETFYRIGR